MTFIGGVIFIHHFGTFRDKEWRYLLHRNAGSPLQILELLHKLCANSIQHLFVIQILLRLRGQVQIVVGRVVLVVVVERNFVRHVRTIQQDSRFVRPAARHVANGVPTTAEYKHGNTKRLDELDATRVTL